MIYPSSGEVVIDGRKLESKNVVKWRSKIGFVTQDPIIFEDTIFNNITLWADKTKENKSRFDEVCNLVSISEVIDSLELKEDTLINLSGSNFSGGEKQRIAIARELFKNVDLLILDEATSALDNKTEDKVQKSIEKLHGKLTILTIAHRLSTVENCDVIFEIENGKILKVNSK